MEVRQIRTGLWRWTAPHPEWTSNKGGPGGWEQMVGCVYYEPGQTAVEPEAPGVVLFDPLAPPEGGPDAERFWKALDQDVERCGRRVLILIGNEYHSRNARIVRDRYAERFGAEICAHEALQGRLPVTLDRTFTGETELPGRVHTYPVPSLSAGEVVYYIEPLRAAVIADALVASPGGGVRVAPPFWVEDLPEARAKYRVEFRDDLRRLAGLPLELLLVSHGPPALQDARRALEEALRAPAWGE